MGSLPSLGGARAVQASARDILAFGHGAPVTEASDTSFIPLHAEPTSVGNPVADCVNEEGRHPAHFVSIRYMSPTGFRTVQVPWTAGMTVQHALHMGKRIDSVFRLANPLGSARVVGNQRVRLHYQLRAGDVLKLNPTAKPLL